MKAARIHSFGPPDVVVVEDVPTPEPGPCEVLVRVVAAGVAPWDATIREGKSKVSPQPPLTLGSDISGVVEKIGAGATDFAPADEVYGVTNPQFCGAQAEFAVAAAPVIAVTAWQMLFQYAYATRGQTVIAKSIIDSSKPGFEQDLPKVDAILDTVGGNTIQRCAAALKPGGQLVTVVSTQPQPAGAVFFYAEVTTARLETVTTLFDTGTITARVGSILPLLEVRQAQSMLEGAPHKYSKIVLLIANVNQTST